MPGNINRQTGHGLLCVFDYPLEAAVTALTGWSECLKRTIMHKTKVGMLFP
jgi:hypothetical protein